MGWAGKIIGGGLGFVLGGPLGAVLGVAMGNSFDKNQVGSGVNNRFASQEKLQMIFFTTTFSMLAKFARADGKISRSELDLVENFIKNGLQLDKRTHELAIKIFNAAKDNPDSFLDFAHQFYSYFSNQRELLITMMELLTQLAMADGSLHEKEKYYLNETKKIFNISDMEFEGIKSRYINEEDIEKYYKILGTTKDASKSEIKKKYRELAKKYHPDYIIGKGLPEEFVKFAQEKFKEIQEAYEIVMDEKRAS